MAQPNRNVLVIAYYFPPMGLSGVQRTLKFVKYLPKYGWQPTVLTVTPTGYYAQDYTLLEEIRHLHIDVERIGSLDPNRFLRKKGVVNLPSERRRKILTFMSDTLFIPDNKIGWKRQVLKRAEELFGKKHYDVVFATAPPFTDLVIGAELKERFQKPLVLDYRDPWLDYPYKYFPTGFHRWANYKLEKRAVHSASAVVATNRRVKELILQHHKFLNYHDVAIIPQGYDPEDFVNAAPEPRTDGRMRFAHAGVFYGDRTPVYFLQALRKVFDERPALKDQIEAYFIGTFHEEHKEKIRKLGLEGQTTVTGYLDHARCIRMLLSSDVLWLMLNNDRQSPGKLYEYLGARKPILACIPDGFIQQTLRETGGAAIVAPDDVGMIASTIVRLFEQFKAKTLPRPREDMVTKYDRAELTGELAKIFGFLAE